MLLPSSFVARRLVASAPPSLLPAPLPSRREAHLWYVVPNEVKDASLLQEYMEILSPCEKENVLSMKGEGLQKCALLSRVLIRTTLSRYTDCRIHPRSFKFRKNRFGKPEIGIDIEEKERRPMTNILSLAHRYFSSHEVQYLDSFVDPETQKFEFLKIWTLKEAYVKALGRGFSGSPFKDFTIRFEGSKGLLASKRPKVEDFRIAVEAASDPENVATNWQFALAELGGSHFAAICMEKDPEVPGAEHDLLKLNVWKTLPFVEDECVSGTDAVINISGLIY